MKRIEYFLWLLVCIITPNYAMLQSVLKSSRRTIISPPKPQQQKRSLWSPRQFKALHDQPHLPTFEFHRFSPEIGASVIESNVLKNMVFMQEDPHADALIKVAQLIFDGIEVTGEIWPTNNKSNAAYALEPEILGLIVGALERELLQNPEISAHIIHEWQHVYKNKTGNKDKISKKKIQNLLDIITEAYQTDKNGLISLLLAFLYVKGNPETNHDMIHFLIGINNYIPVFSPEVIPLTLKRNIPFSEEGYTKEEHENLLKKLATIQSSEEHIVFIQNNFPLIINTLIEQKKDSNYPAAVIMGRYGYKGEEPVSDCVETVLHNMLNFLLYNNQLQRFDLSLLPSDWNTLDTFKEFYTKYSDEKSINTPSCGQDFMNLVSGVPGVSYRRGNYEMEPTEKNLMTVFNYCFNKNINSLDHLAMLLSNTERQIKFAQESITYKIDEDFLSVLQITIYIINQITQTKTSMRLYLSPGHGWSTFFTEDPIEKNLFDLSLLTSNYINPLVRSLFYVYKNFSIETFKALQLKIDSSAYYSFPTESSDQKIHIIETILQHHPDDTIAINYAYNLFKKLSLDDLLIPIVFDILESKRLQEKLIQDPDLNKRFTIFLARNLGNIINHFKSFNEKYINLFYQKVNTEELKNQILNSFWTNYIPTSENRVGGLLFIVKGDLLGRNQQFDEYFLQEIRDILRAQDESKKNFFSLLYVDEIQKIYAMLPEKEDKILFSNNLRMFKMQDLLPSSLLELSESEVEKE